MENSVLILFIVGFVVLLAIIILIRIKTNNKVEIKTNDLVVALIPVVLILFLSGEISKVTIGDLSFEKKFSEAVEKKLENDITPVDFGTKPVGNFTTSTVSATTQEVSSERKATREELKFLDKDLEGLTFELGYTNYDPTIIKEYFDKLTGLKYIIIKNENGLFKGLFDAQILMRYVNQSENESWTNLKNKIEASDLDYFKNIPSFISSDVAITEDEDRLQAMKKFQEHKLTLLPVIDADGLFKGILQRDNLANEILIMLSNTIEDPNSSK